MATITVKTIVHGSFQAVAEQAISEYRQKGVQSVEFDFNSRIYKVDNNSTTQSLWAELYANRDWD